MADLLGFDVRFESGMSKSPRGLILSRFRWIDVDFIRVNMFKTCLFCLNPFMGLFLRTDQKEVEKKEDRIKTNLEVDFFQMLAPGRLNPQLWTNNSKSMREILPGAWFSGLESSFKPQKLQTLLFLIF